MTPVEPLCLKCKKLMFPRRNGVYVVFGKSTNKHVSYVHADAWECRVCGHQIIRGWGKGYTTPQPMEKFMKHVDEFEIWTIFVEDKIEFYSLKPNTLDF